MFAVWSSYERAETYRTEVPRMLLDDPAQLEEYVMKSKDKYVSIHALLVCMYICALFKCSYVHTYVHVCTYALDVQCTGCTHTHIHVNIHICNVYLNNQAFMSSCLYYVGPSESGGGSTWRVWVTSRQPCSSTKQLGTISQ